MNKKRQYYISASLFVIFVCVFNACKKNEPLPENPYSKINRSSETITDTTNPNSIVGIHKNIFSVKCANPGCHDGNFEPDFRTVQSSYSTLVYHPVVKKLAPWNYRVLPNDTANSWFWQRINHSLIISGKDTSQGRMPLYSSPLSKQELDNVKNWILGGALDIFNQPPKFPNQEPSITGYLSFNTNYTARYDSTRENNIYSNPFVADTGIVMNLTVFPTDDSTNVENLIHNKLKLSLNADDFSNAIVINGSYLNVGAYQAWLFTFNTNLFKVGDTVFMRYYTNDGDRTTDTEMPRTDMLYPYKTYWSFKITPK